MFHSAIFDRIRWCYGLAFAMGLALIPLGISAQKHPEHPKEHPGVTIPGLTVVTRVQGDRVGYVYPSYRAPEAFLRELNKQEVKDIVPLIVATVLALTTLVLAGLYFFRAFREGQVRWGFPIRIGILAAVLMLVQMVNGLPAFFQGYDTSQALETFLGIRAIGFLLRLVFVGLGMAMVVALAVALFRSLYPDEMGPARWFGLLRLRESGVRLWRDTLLLGAALELVRKGTSRLELFVNYRWLTDYLKPGDLSPPGLNAYLPFLNQATEAVWGIIVNFFLVLAVVLTWQRVLKRTWVLLVGFGVLGVLLVDVGPAKDLYHFAILTGLTLISLAVFIFLIGWVIRFNFLAYMIAMWFGFLIVPGWSYLRSPDAFYQLNGAAMLLLGFVPLALPLIAYLKVQRAPLSKAVRTSD